MELLNNLINRIFDLKWFYTKLITFFVLLITAIDNGILSFIPQLNPFFITVVSIIISALSAIMAFAIALPAGNFNPLEKDITKKMQDINAFTAIFIPIFAFISLYFTLNFTQQLANSKVFDAFFLIIQVLFFLMLAIVIIFTLFAAFKMFVKKKVRKDALPKKD
jgi:hypothetical protein